jgi:histidine ammonia-lyase
MGSNAATKLIRVVDNTERVLAIELFNAAQALEFRGVDQTSSCLKSWHHAYRKVVPFISDDCVMHPWIEASVQFLQNDK